MKKILFIGKFNSLTEDTNFFLGQYFTVQLCSENADAVKGMLKMCDPDLVLISLVGLSPDFTPVFQELEMNYRKLPVITFGTDGEMAEFKHFYANKQFEALRRPIGNPDLLYAICRRLNLDPDELEQQKKERAGRTKKHVLLVDDDPTLLRSLKTLLQEEYKISIAVSGAQAMMILGKGMPDIIFLDYEMPVCDGKQTLQMIREMEETRDVPVVFLTGVADRQHVEAILELKPAGYLLKPPVAAMIIQMIENLT